MTSRLASALGVLAFAVLAARCGGSPAAPEPSPQPATTPVPPPAPAPDSPLEPYILLTTAPVSPQDGSTVPYFGDAALTAANASAPSGRVVLLTFQLSTDESFAAPFHTRTVPQAAGDDTTVHLEMSFTESKLGRTIFWRVRPGSGESVGGWTAARRFTIGDRIDTPDRLFADAPIPLGPASGSILSSTVDLAARAGAHSSGPTELWFFLSTTPSFPAIPKCQSWLGNLGTEGHCGLGNLAPGTYYWRVQTATTRALSNMANGFYSAFSPTQSFTVAAVDIKGPKMVAPAAGGLVYPRPVVTVTNAARTGVTGPLSYRFEIASSVGSGAPVISAIVAEGPGQTSWTPPADLLIGNEYNVHVRAIDPANGYEGASSDGRTFAVVSRSTTLLTLDIETRCHSFSIPAATTDTLGRVPFTATTDGTMTIRLDTLEVAGQFSGIIQGGVSAGLTFAPFSIGLNNPAGLATFAALTADGSLSGLFDGTVNYYTSYPQSCTGTGFRWTLRR